MGDAYDLPWVPYFGHEHMQHGFVVVGVEGSTLRVVDPYDNVTRWGRAVPVTVRVGLHEVERALTAGSWATLEEVGRRRDVSVADIVARNCKVMSSDATADNVRRFLTSYDELTRESLQNLTLQTWLLTRDRELHSRWLFDVANVYPPADDLARVLADQVVPQWKKAQELSYIALRRAEGGKSVPNVQEELRIVLRNEIHLAKNSAVSRV
ncbi:hypothetical protein ACETK3_19245 [Arthrobacter sp. E44]|uniref:hypothetical protein n=1 Tax=Arthrobacter sp. E44 TaxID=3341794 RepID=UPI0035A724BF